MANFDVTAKLRGLDGVMRRIEHLADQTDIEKAIDKGVALMERDAVRNAPVDQGEMRAAVTVEHPEPLKRRLGSPTKQAIFTEFSPLILKGATPAQPRTSPFPFGTDAHGKTVPWIRPAIYANAAKLREFVEEALREKFR